jgi:hypothetical protein
MALKTNLAILTVTMLIAGCASQQQGAGTASGASSTGTAASPASNVRTVKSRDGTFEGEMVGTPAANSKFAKLQIGMTMREVTGLIGGPDDMIRHETGKRWIPFYFGNDAQRLQVIYKGEGCLTYTGGNVFGGGDSELIRITAAPKDDCLDT